ncbi:hypothetical protein GW17_00036977 [Ensete ventricosum]|nr:hypothetical protein GW17_00036977 [Ensete ventricosum]
MLLRLGRPVDLKGNERSATVIDLLLFDSEKELTAYSLRGTERRCAVARTGTLGRENKAANAAKGTTLASRCRSRLYYRWGTEGEEKADALEVSSFDIDKRLSFDSKKR